MYVLTGEGETWRSRKLWTTHRVLGVFQSKDDARNHVLSTDAYDDEEIYIITNLDDLEDRERLTIP